MNNIRKNVQIIDKDKYKTELTYYMFKTDTVIVSEGAFFIYSRKILTVDRLNFSASTNRFAELLK